VLAVSRLSKGPHSIIPIAELDVPIRFDDPTMERLATTYPKLTDYPKKRRYIDGIREAAILYVRYAGTGGDRDRAELEITDLGAAAAAESFCTAAKLLGGLSPLALNCLRFRVENRITAAFDPGPIHAEAIGRDGEILSRQKSIQSARVWLPTPDDLLDHQRQGRACEMLALLCRSGGTRLPGGDIVPYGPAQPESRRDFPRRQAERYFLMLLRNVWFEAKGIWPGKAANANHRTLFVKMVQECLNLAGAGEADAVGLINEFNARGFQKWHEGNSRRESVDAAEAAKKCKIAEKRREALSKMMTAWRNSIGVDKAITVQAIVEIANRVDLRGVHAHPGLRRAVIRIAAEAGKINTRKLHKWLSKHKDREIDCHKITCTDTGSSTVHWQVVRADGAAEELVVVGGSHTQHKYQL
jgi:hypothetical protein